MAILPIVEIPDPILRKRARKVRRIDKKTLTIAHNMVETMRNAGGVGLAANQVGELQRIIVIQLPDEEEARIYFNPEITKSVGVNPYQGTAYPFNGLIKIGEIQLDRK